MKLNIIEQNGRICILPRKVKLKNLSEEKHGINPDEEYDVTKAKLDDNGILIQQSTDVKVY